MRNTESGGGRSWGSAGASPYRSCGRSIIRRGEFHESPFLPIRVPSVANNLLMVIGLRNADCGMRKPKRGGGRCARPIRRAETHKLGKADAKHWEPSKCGMRALRAATGVLRAATA